MHQTITPFLLFYDNAEEAVDFYMSVFRNASIHKKTYYGEVTSRPSGTVLTVEFQINGQEFVALNGPDIDFTPAISFQISCDGQDEVDELWERLTADGGEPSVCGWLTDKYGLSWQVTPRILPQLMQDENRTKADNVMKAMMGMSKIDVAEIQRAYDEA